MKKNKGTNEEIRLRDGGLNSPNCKCGREWKPRWIGKMAYHRICLGCGKRTKDCTCLPLKIK